MRYFILFCMFTIFIFAYSYQSEPYNYSNSPIINQEEEYNSSKNLNEEEYIEYTETTPLISYMTLNEARKEAKNEHKFLLVKIESTNCPTCSRLNTLLDTNENIKNMVTQYTKAVKFNPDYDRIPPKLNYIGTPTIFLLNSKGTKILMKLQGSGAVDDIEKSLELFIYDNS